MLWEQPKKAWLTKGSGEAKTSLNAFDNALLDANIGNLNLVKLSSVLPPETEIIHKKPDFKPGEMVPCIYTKITSNNKKIASAIGIGISNDFGLVYEYSGEDINKEYAEQKVEKMIKEGFKTRKKKIKKIKTLSIQKNPTDNNISTMAAVVFSKN